MDPKSIRGRLLGLLTWALVAEFAAAFVHHVYGGIHYGTAERLWMAFGFAIAIVVTVGLLRYYSRVGGKAALAAAIGLIVTLWIIGTGFFEGGYNHAYKCVLYLAAVTPERAIGLHPALMARDFIYPPDDALFELTGVLQFLAGCVVAALTYRLIREVRLNTDSAGRSVSETGKTGERATEEGARNHGY
jgi:hypothetical protein